MSCFTPISCPKCSSCQIKKNGKKPNNKQNYLCKCCGRQFIGDHALTYRGCHSKISQRILIMLVRGCGIRDIAAIEKVSCTKVLSVLLNVRDVELPHHCFYESIEIDEFWTFVGRKSKRVWLIYAFDRVSKKIISYVWGKRNSETVMRLKIQLCKSQISFRYVYSDRWICFRKIFKGYPHYLGRKYTIGIEGNHCLLRHRIRRFFRKSCNFSKSLKYHFSAFRLMIWFSLLGCLSGLIL